MRFSLLSIALAATCLAAAPSIAQQNSRDAMRQYGQLTMPHEDRDWQTFADYDFDRLESGQSKYYANRYYRDRRYYQPRALGAADRIYRGSNDYYYCRRPDGTTGPISGLSGSGLDRILGRGESELLATLVNTTGSTALVRAIDAGKLVCR